MTSPRQLRKLLIAGLVCTNLLVVAFCSYFLYQSRLQHEHNAEQLTQNIASAVDQNVSASVEKIDLVLRTAIDELERRLAEGKFDEPSTNDFLTRMASRLPEVEALRVANADGDVIFGRDVIRSNRVTWADRDYFIHLRSHPDGGLQVSKARPGRVSKQYIVGFARRYNFPDGRFAGVISAPIPVSHFSNILGQFEVGPHGAIVLRDTDLGLIARVPAIADKPAGQLGNTVVSEELRHLIDAGVRHASYYTPASSDGYQRLITFRRLEKSPMTVLVGSAKEDYLAGWQGEFYLTSAIALGFVLLSVLAGGFLSQQLRKTEQREQELRRSIETRQRQHESMRSLNEIAALSHLPLAE